MPRLYRPRLFGGYATPTLSLADNGDGTGATATITGNTWGTNTVYVAPSPYAAFTSYGTRSGDGTLTISVPVGKYIAYTSGPSGVSPPVVSQATGGTSAGQGPHAQITAAVVQVVTDMGLEIDGATVPVELRDEFNLDEGAPTQPVLIVAPCDGDQQERLFGSTWRVTRGVLVAYVAPGRLDFAGVLAGELGERLDWRDDLAARLREAESLDLDFLSGFAVADGPPIDPAKVKKGYKVSATRFRYVVQVDRPEFPG
jgi:hypothetical protein